MNPTGIEWTDYTWNPLTGCEHGCAYCYARRIAARFYKTAAGKRFEPEFHPGRLEQPIKKAKPAKVFVCSMADLFGSWVPAEQIEAVLKTIRRADWHTFQILTKNPVRLADFDIPSNAWIGTTVTNQEDWDLRVPALMKATAAVHFVSVEPIMGEIVPGDAMPEWVIIGPVTGRKRDEDTGRWIQSLTEIVDKQRTPVFHKPGCPECAGFDGEMVRMWPSGR